MVPPTLVDCTDHFQGSARIRASWDLVHVSRTQPSVPLAPLPLRLCRSRRRGAGEGQRAPAGSGPGAQMGPGQPPPRGAGGP